MPEQVGPCEACGITADDERLKDYRWGPEAWTLLRRDDGTEFWWCPFCAIYNAEAQEPPA
jgi:hypothetical protein